MHTLIVALLLAASLSGGDRSGPQTPGFGGRTPLDLTGPTPTAPVAGAALAADPRSVAVAECADPAAGQMLWLPETGDDGLAAEAARMTEGVRREQDVLVLQPKDGEALRFVDWTLRDRPGFDGDFVRYRYVGTLTDSGWWRVEVQYGHDAPSSWLVNPASGHALHVHNGGEVTTVSADGRWLATFDPNAAPYRLAVVFLGEGAPTLAVDCLFTPTEKQHPSACGFRGDRYEARWGDAGLALARTHDGWQLLGTAPGADCRAPR